MGDILSRLKHGALCLLVAAAIWTPAYMYWTSSGIFAPGDQVEATEDAPPPADIIGLIDGLSDKIDLNETSALVRHEAALQAYAGGLEQVRVEMEAFRQATEAEMGRLRAEVEKSRAQAVIPTPGRAPVVRSAGWTTEVEKASSARKSGRRETLK